jgi:hypothetical protein
LKTVFIPISQVESLTERGKPKMFKFIVIAMAVLGALCLLNIYLPEVWQGGVNLGGRVIPYGIFALGGFLILALRAK